MSTATTAPRSDTWVRQTVPSRMIVRDAQFSARQGNLERSHVRALVMAIRNAGELTPVLLWRDPARGDDERLTLLDGAYRLAAYKSANWKGDIPAKVISCDRRRALLIAAGANAQDRMPLSPQEKADMAWRLVREPEAGYSKAEIARATGVSARTIATMRSRWRTLNGAEREPTGAWWRDRSDMELDIEGSAIMTDSQRAAEVKALAEGILNTVGRRARYDESLVADALAAAFGYRLRSMADYLYGEVDEWAEISDVAYDDEGEDAGEDMPF